MSVRHVAQNVIAFLSAAYSLPEQEEHWNAMRLAYSFVSESGARTYDTQ
jgi:hypothetical protein